MMKHPLAFQLKIVLTTWYVLAGMGCPPPEPVITTSAAGGSVVVATGGGGSEPAPVAGCSSCKTHFPRECSWSPRYVVVLDASTGGSNAPCPIPTNQGANAYWKCVDQKGQLQSCNGTHFLYEIPPSTGNLAQRVCAYHWDHAQPPPPHAKGPPVFASNNDSTPDCANVFPATRSAREYEINPDDPNIAIRQRKRDRILTAFYEKGVGLPRSSTRAAPTGHKISVAVLDSVRTNALPSNIGNPQRFGLGRSVHGRIIAGIIDEVAAAGSPQPVIELSHHQVLAYEPDSQYPDELVTKPDYGGDRGFVSDVAQAIVSAVNAAGSNQLIINLSLGWDEAWPPTEQPSDRIELIRRAIEWAACEKHALIFAAAGNSTGRYVTGGYPDKQLALPARLQHFQCRGNSKRPILVAVGSVDAGGVPLSNARVEAEPYLVAMGLDGVMEEGLTACPPPAVIRPGPAPSPPPPVISPHPTPPVIAPHPIPSVILPRPVLTPVRRAYFDRGQRQQCPFVSRPLSGTSISTAVASGTAAAIWMHKLHGSTAPEQWDEQVLAWMFRYAIDTGRSASHKNAPLEELLKQIKRNPRVHWLKLDNVLNESAGDAAVNKPNPRSTCSDPFWQATLCGGQNRLTMVEPTPNPFPCGHCGGNWSPTLDEYVNLWYYAPSNWENLSIQTVEAEFELNNGQKPITVSIVQSGKLVGSTESIRPGSGGEVTAKVTKKTDVSRVSYVITYTHNQRGYIKKAPISMAGP